MRGFGLFLGFNGGAGDAYAVLGYRPELVLDFDDDYYRANSAAATFSDALTHSASSNATMVDSDGLLKWRPHNLALNSATPATQSITVVSGADYTVECTGVSIALSGAGTGTVTEGNPVTITASTTTLTLTVTGATGTMWVYRSDLGGMVDNPDTGNSYVPTTSTARYLPRRGHHVWNGSAWVNEGLLHESEARTNLVLNSGDLTNASWDKNQVTVALSGATSPLGSASSRITETADTNIHTASNLSGISVTSGVSYSWSVFAKAGTKSTIQLSGNSTLFGTEAHANFDLSSGTVGSTGTSATATIENFGNGWYRCTVSAFAIATNVGFFHVILTEGSSSARFPSYTGNVSNYVDVDGAQLEEGPTPSSYIPTSGSTVTRAAETLTIPAAKLPWPTPNVIGPELVTNGEFNADSDWTKDAAWSIGSGVATITSGGASDDLWQPASITAGAVYLVTCDVTITSGALRFRMYENGRYAQETLAAGSNSFTIVSGSAGVGTAFTNSIVILPTTSGTTGTIDNISVREIDPLSVSIQMDGRATGDTYTTTRWYLDANNYITQEINTSDFTFEQAASGTVDAVTGGSFTSGVNTPFNFASTHASTLVAAAVGGTALTDNTTPVALADLSSTDLQLGHSFMGTLKLMRLWPQNITEAGREGASA